MHVSMSHRLLYEYLANNQIFGLNQNNHNCFKIMVIKYFNVCHLYEFWLQFERKKVLVTLRVYETSLEFLLFYTFRNMAIRL